MWAAAALNSWIMLFPVQGRCREASDEQRRLGKDPEDVDGERAVERHTIASVPFGPHPALKSRLQDQPEPEAPSGDEYSRRLIQIRSADSHGHRSSASILINRMYSSRGYRSTPLPDEQLPSRLTLVAIDHDETIGTITVGFDTGEPLHVDDLFAAEADALRRAGHRLCEFTKLAMDSVKRSKSVLASLFHVAYLYAYREMGYDTLLIEVNPRHVRYYQRMLGFTAQGEQRLNRRVNAPAVLLCLDFNHSREQIAQFGGRPELSLINRSLYPYFFSVVEEAGIMGRLKRTLAHAPMSAGPPPPPSVPASYLASSFL